MPRPIIPILGFLEFVFELNSAHDKLTRNNIKNLKEKNKVLNKLIFNKISILSIYNKKFKKFDY